MPLVDRWPLLRGGHRKEEREMGEAARNLDLDLDLGDETRAEPRAAVYASVDLFSEHNFWSGLTMNMSEGGLFVATHNVVPVGTTLVLHMLLPFEREPVVTLAQVRWTRAYTDQHDVPPGLGLQFVDPDAKSLKKIKKFVATVREPLFFED
jgi:uncharacterized protein (TIGR02266 family)